MYMTPWLRLNQVFPLSLGCFCFLWYCVCFYVDVTMYFCFSCSHSLSYVVLCVVVMVCCAVVNVRCGFGYVNHVISMDESRCFIFFLFSLYMSLSVWLRGVYMFGVSCCFHVSPVVAFPVFCSRVVLLSMCFVFLSLSPCPDSRTQLLCELRFCCMMSFLLLFFCFHCSFFWCRASERCVCLDLLFFLFSVNF